jgi:hypothetical protein
MPMLPCPGILSEVRPKSLHRSRLRPAPSPFLVLKTMSLFLKEEPQWVRRSMSVGCLIRRPSSN